MLSQDIKDMVRDDINFHHNGHATYSKVKEVIKISKKVWERATQAGERYEFNKM